MWYLQSMTDAGERSMSHISTREEVQALQYYVRFLVYTADRRFSLVPDREMIVGRKGRTIKPAAVRLCIISLLCIQTVIS